MRTICYSKRARDLSLGALAIATAACLGPGDITGEDGDERLVGTIIVATLTTGPGSDPNGYFASLNEGLAQPIEANGSVTFSEVPVGTHNVRLDGVDGCVVTTANPVPVLMLADSTVTTQFEVSCP